MIHYGDDEVVFDNILYSSTRSIINAILIWCSSIPSILIYLEYVRIIFQKYMVSFRLDKCNFLKTRVEFVGNDLTTDGICPATSKFNMINDWILPLTGQGLHSFVGIIRAVP